MPNAPAVCCQQDDGGELPVRRFSENAAVGRDGSDQTQSLRGNQHTHLDGETVDLSALRGRRLVLFWNPSCGFCQQMLPDVKTWERNHPQDAPELLVISTGSPDANREQGFRSPVLLDPNFGAGRVFGAEGTPSAVVLDEEGRVSSEVGVGAEAVFALAGAVPAGSGRSA